MHRIALALALTFALPATASAQLQVANARPITTQVKDAGIYHLATGTWTRGLGAVALAGPEVIYDNTCTVGYYFGVQNGDKVLDSGRIPSTSSPLGPGSLPGSCDFYRVNGFSIGYCTFGTSTAIDLSFIDCYAACDGAGVFPTPTATFHLVNLPGIAAGGLQGCWTMTVDLSNTTTTFALGGDCNGSYDGDASMDSFGWAWTEALPSTGSDTGPMYAGDPLALFQPMGQACNVGAGTTFAGATPGRGTGIGVLDQMELVDGPTAPGCYWWGGYGGAGGNPLTSFYMQLQGETTCESGGNWGPFCFGDGSGTACPCANLGTAGQGCANGSGLGAILEASGSPRLSNDSVSFTVSGVNGAKPGILLRTDHPMNGGNGIPVGDGLLCASGASQRSQIQVADASGGLAFTDWYGAPFGTIANVASPTYFQFWHRDPTASPCGSGFNFSNAWRMTYVP